MNKTFTIEEIKALYDTYLMYAVEWHDAKDHQTDLGYTWENIKKKLKFTEWLDVYEQGNDKLIYY